MGNCSHDANFLIWRIFWERNRRLMKNLNVHLPFSNTKSLIFNAFTVWFLSPDNKHNKITNFSDKSFKVNQVISPTANCLGRADRKLNIPFINRWTRECFPKDIPLFMMSTGDRLILLCLLMSTQHLIQKFRLGTQLVYLKILNGINTPFETKYFPFLNVIVISFGCRRTSTLLDDPNCSWYSPDITQAGRVSLLARECSLLICRMLKEGFPRM